MPAGPSAYHPAACLPHPRDRGEIKDVNTRYHDAAAADLRRQVGHRLRRRSARTRCAAKLVKALGARARRPSATRSRSAPGTGYFSLNLLQLGLIERSTATDISPGMLDDASRATAERARARGARRSVTEAEALPFADESFDLVFGHAVLHHIPDLERAFAEFHRVLRPGGTIVFCGEPSRYGDRLAAVPKRAGAARRARSGAALLARPGRRAGSTSTIGDGHELETEVDVHAFAPAELRELARRAPASSDVRVSGEELARERLRLAAAHARVERRARAASHGAGAASPSAATWPCSASTPRCSSRACPPELFYNLVLSARKPV